MCLKKKEVNPSYFYGFRGDMVILFFMEAEWANYVIFTPKRVHNLIM